MRLRIAAIGVVPLVLSGCLFTVESWSAFGPPAGPGGELEPDGSFLLDGSTEPNALDGIQIIPGNLVIADVPRALLTNFELERVEGDVIIRENPTLGSLTFNALRGVGGDVVIERNPQLQNVTFGTEDIGGTLRIAQNPALYLISFRDLVRLGALEIETPDLTQVNFEVLTEVANDVVIGRVGLEANAATVRVRLDALQTVGGDFAVMNNRALNTLSAQSLVHVGGALIIDSNAALTVVDMPALRTVDDGLCLCRNASLDGCVVDALATQAEVQGGVNLSGNANTCRP